jgi:hypothetical protein
MVPAAMSTTILISRSQNRCKRLKHPSFLYHKILEGHAGDLEVLADVGNFDGVRPEAFHGHDCALRHKSFGDEKRISMIPAPQNFR